MRVLFARLATVACALALFIVTVTFTHQALADGREGRRAAPTPAPQQQTYTPTTPDIQELAGGVPPAAESGFSPCLSAEEAYLAISQTTQGEDLQAITAALHEVENDPAGLNSDPNAPTLANRLRTALGLGRSSEPCETVLTALNDSVQLAQVASTAEGPLTGGIGEPPPTSPSYTPTTVGTLRRTGHGYCTNVSAGCET